MRNQTPVGERHAGRTAHAYRLCAPRLLRSNQTSGALRRAAIVVANFPAFTATTCGAECELASAETAYAGSNGPRASAAADSLWAAHAARRSRGGAFPEHGGCADRDGGGAGHASGDPRVLQCDLRGDWETDSRLANWQSTGVMRDGVVRNGRRHRRRARRHPQVDGRCPARRAGVGLCHPTYRSSGGGGGLTGSVSPPGVFWNELLRIQR